MHLILASSSPYRAELLKRLQLKFSQRSPHIDECAQHLNVRYVFLLILDKVEGQVFEIRAVSRQFSNNVYLSLSHLF